MHAFTPVKKSTSIFQSNKLSMKYVNDIYLKISQRIR